jgi:hypothetical protein
MVDVTNEALEGKAQRVAAANEAHHVFRFVLAAAAS